jgi:predicted site-specific integrase-resolvase
VKEAGISNLEAGVPTGHLTVEAAAMRLGLDPFTVYSFIQRDRLTPILDDEGVFIVAEEEVNQLAQREKE